VLNRLPPKERQIVDLLYQQGSMTAAEVTEGLPGSPSGSAVRTMLKRLEDKGFVRREEHERGYLYSPAVSDQTARKSALSEVVRVFFNGSPTSAASVRPDRHQGTRRAGEDDRRSTQGERELSRWRCWSPLP
jgi:predicted transcriptional regulator